MKNLDIFLDRVESDGIFVATNNADEVPVGTVFTQLVKIRAGGASDDGSGIELCSTAIFWVRSNYSFKADGSAAA